MRLLVLALLAVSAFAQNNPVTATGSLDDTQLGVFADRAYSTLAAAVTSTSTTLTLDDASAFPNAEYWVVVCPLNQCGVGASAAGGETIFITGKSGNVLTIGATGRQVTWDQTGTATGGSNPTHAIGEAVVLAPVAGQLNRITAELAALAGGGSILMTFDGQGSDIATGASNLVVARGSGNITGAKVLSYQTCSISIDVWVDSYANHPPTDADSITAAAPLALSSANKATSALTGWTTAFSAGDEFIFNVDSNTGCENVVVVLETD